MAGKRNYSLILQFILLISLILLSTACSNKEPVEACLHGHTYGFFGGLWHGIIAPIDLILMIFRSDIVVFASNNNGIGYALGFLLGSGGWGFLGGHGARRSRKN
jgi:hypothetical protein